MIQRGNIRNATCPHQSPQTSMPIFNFHLIAVNYEFIIRRRSLLERGLQRELKNFGTIRTLVTKRFYPSSGNKIKPALKPELKTILLNRLERSGFPL